MKRSHLLLALPALGVFLASATIRELPASPADTVRAEALEPSRALQGRVLHESRALAAPGDLEVAGDRLILADDFADRNLRVLRRSDGIVERSFGRKGRGPREFESIVGIDVIDPSGEIMVHDPMLQRVTWIDLEKDFDGDRWVTDRSVKLNANAQLLVTAWKPDGLVGVGSLTEGRLAHLSPDGRQLRVTGSAPVSPDAVRPRVWARTIQSRMEHSPDRTRWAVVSRFADRLEIYDAHGDLLTVGDRPYGFDPQDLIEEDPHAVRFGYIDVAATESRVFALFSGRVRNEGGANYGRLIHVFDWEGHLLDVWELDCPLITVAVAPDGRELYGVRHDPLPAVLAYSLN